MDGCPSPAQLAGNSEQSSILWRHAYQQFVHFDGKVKYRENSQFLFNVFFLMCVVTDNHFCVILLIVTAWMGK